MASPISQDLELSTICDALGSVPATKVFKIGILLGIPQHVLDGFKENSLSAVIDYWLRGNTTKPISWKSIVTALESDYVGEPGLAEKIRRQYCQLQQDIEDSSATSQSPADKMDPDVKMDLEFILEKNIKLILYKYASYVDCLRAAIYEKGVTPEDLRVFLLSLPASSKSCNGQTLNLLSDKRQELEKQTTIAAIFAFLTTECASFLNYDIFQSILNKYKVTDDEGILVSYSEHLEAYINKHKISEFVKVNRELVKHRAGSKELTLKFDVSTTCRLAKVCELKKVIAEIMDLNPSALEIVDIKDGCVIVKFMIPAFIADALFTPDTVFTSKQMEKLQSKSVLWIKCNGHTYNFEKQQASRLGMSTHSMQNPYYSSLKTERAVDPLHLSHNTRPKLKEVCRPTTSSLYYVLGNLKTRWEKIGSILEVSDADLKKIKRNHKFASRCMIEVFECWICKGKDCSWATIVKALQSIDHNKLAKIVEEYTRTAVRVGTGAEAMPGMHKPHWLIKQFKRTTLLKDGLTEQMAECLKETAFYWFEIGCLLGIKETDLSSIEISNQHDSYKCLESMVKQLVKEKSTWTELVFILNEMNFIRPVKLLEQLAQENQITFIDFEPERRRAHFIPDGGQENCETIRSTLNLSQPCSDDETLTNIYDNVKLSGKDDKNLIVTAKNFRIAAIKKIEHLTDLEETAKELDEVLKLANKLKYELIQAKGNLEARRREQWEGGGAELMEQELSKKLKACEKQLINAKDNCAEIERKLEVYRADIFSCKIVVKQIQDNAAEWNTDDDYTKVGAAIAGAAVGAVAGVSMATVSGATLTGAALGGGLLSIPGAGIGFLLGCAAAAVGVRSAAAANPIKADLQCIINITINKLDG